MNKSILGQKCQELVDLTRIIRESEEMRSEIKWEVVFDVKAEDGIKCNGGTVYFVEGHSIARLSEDKLREELANNGIDANKIADIINNSKTENHTIPDVFVRLDK